MKRKEVHIYMKHGKYTSFSYEIDQKKFFFFKTQFCSLRACDTSIARVICIIYQPDEKPHDLRISYIYIKKRSRSEYHTQLAEMSVDKIVDLTAGWGVF